VGKRLVKSPKLDLVIDRPSGKTGFEIKFSAAPKPTKGFWQAMQDLEIARAFIVAPVARRYPLAAGVDVVPVWDVPAILGAAAGA